MNPKLLAQSLFGEQLQHSRWQLQSQNSFGMAFSTKYNLISGDTIAFLLSRLCATIVWKTERTSLCDLQLKGRKHACLLSQSYCSCNWICQLFLFCREELEARQNRTDTRKLCHAEKEQRVDVPLPVPSIDRTVIQGLRVQPPWVNSRRV